MNKFIKSIGSSVTAFAKEEEGAQVVEYALIIAVVSIGLVILLSTLLGSGTGGAFATFISRVQACLGTSTCV